MTHDTSPSALRASGSSPRPEGHLDIAQRFGRPDAQRLCGISTRAVDDLVEAMGVETGISKSEVSRICAGLDEMVGAFRTRTLGHIEFPYVSLDATYLNVRNGTGQVVSMAVIVASGIAADGSREILGLDVGDSEDETLLAGFPHLAQAARPRWCPAGDQ